MIPWRVRATPLRLYEPGVNTGEENDRPEWVRRHAMYLLMRHEPHVRASVLIREILCWQHFV